MLRFLQVVAIASLVSTRAVLPRLLKISRRKHSVTSRTHLLWMQPIRRRCHRTLQRTG
jgi:uncharacterized protein with PQ loop repeat